MLNSNLNRVKSKVILIFYIFLFTISFAPNVSASCSEGQIDINTASAEELDELYGIGPVKAEAIIHARTFDFIDDLINVNGIGEVTLNKIKEEGLACVEDEEFSNEEVNNGKDSFKTRRRNANW